jgi:hypothetical protein
MPKRKTPADYHSLASMRGFRWLGPQVATVLTKTSWQCEQGHIWEARYNDIQQGKGCPVCAVCKRAQKRRTKPAEYRALAKERGFRWLGPEVPSIRMRTTWECLEGHRWEARYHDIQRGSGCPACYGNVAKAPVDYHALAEERGFRWLGPEVANIKDKTAWRCEEGHVWEARYNDIQQGSGCPDCAVYQRAEQWRRKPADYHVLAEERGFCWLGPEVPTTLTKTTWKCQEDHIWEARYSDISNGSGCPVCAGKIPKTSTDYHLLARECGFHWLGPEVSGTSMKTGWECKEGHRWEASYSNIRMGTGCPFCAGNAPKTATDYAALAEWRGFRWLGPEVPSIKTNTVWECKAGHQWEAAYNSVQGGTGCPICAVDRLAEERRKKPADYSALAEDRGFLWLGPEVPNNTSQTWWECQNGHQWEANYHNIRQGTGCPYCVDIIAGAPVSQIQRELCELLGGELNYPLGKYRIDVALQCDNLAVAVEYDGWYWHAGRDEEDAQRDEEIIAAGWCILRIRSNRQLPSREQLDAAIDHLLNGEKQVEIVLKDWGVGPTRFEVEQT